jgi:hypothetical protein
VGQDNGVFGSGICTARGELLFLDFGARLGTPDEEYDYECQSAIRHLFTPDARCRHTYPSYEAEIKLYVLDFVDDIVRHGVEWVCETPIAPHHPP